MEKIEQKFQEAFDANKNKRLNQNRKIGGFYEKPIMVGTRDLVVTTCSSIRNAIKDEQSAAEGYAKLSNKLKELKVDSNADSIVNEIRNDEIDHKKKLEKIYSRYCGGK
jgi:rubrerythrin